MSDRNRKLSTHRARHALREMAAAGDLTITVQQAFRGVRVLQGRHNGFVKTFERLPTVDELRDLADAVHAAEVARNRALRPRRFVNSDGYVVARMPDGRLMKEHRLAAGVEDPSLQVHHRDMIRNHNSSGNLALLDPQAHRREHCGHWLQDGVWWKRCRNCGEAHPEDAFPTKRYVNGVRKTRGNCRRCDLERVHRLAELRRAARAASSKWA